MAQLGVNIDHIATIRQARRTYEPDPVWAAAEAQLGGAECITVHLREDRRHIQDHDVERLKGQCHVKLNLEMAATDEMVKIARKIGPQMATLVPEGRHEVTTEGGLDVAGQLARMKKVVARLADAGVAASAFIDAEPQQVEAARKAGFLACELHTGPYAQAFHQTRGTGVAIVGKTRYAANAQDMPVAKELEQVARAGRLIVEAGMMFNAGHALNYLNVQAIAALPGVRELHIGHAIVARAVFIGFRQAVAEMKALIA